ncbi:MAG TPA: EAL domain-containing protein [Gammaproteobacteria bacterium]|nr:EAL domain-containing protein [Gammaproteobacteria bacterium]
MNTRIFFSLKSRYAAVSLVLIVLVCTSAAVGYKIVSTSQQQAAQNKAYQYDMLEANRLLRNDIWNSRESLVEFLLEPGIGNARENTLNELDKARNQIKTLLKQAPEHHNEMISILQTLNAEIELLVKHTQKVIETRLNTPKQYPALAIASGTMLPSQTKFYSAIELAMQEITDDDPTSYYQETYQAFEKLNHLWTLLISNFRMYLANRLGSFNESKLPIQEKNNKLQLIKIQKILDKLTTFSEQGKLAMVSSESLKTMKASFKVWRNGYAKVEKIHHSGVWRTDKEILLNDIKPLYLKIWILGQTVENIFRKMAAEDINNLSSISSVQLRIIVATSIIAIILILIGYLTLNRMILQPLAILTNALNEESAGKKVANLPISNAQELDELLSAFTTMQKEIRERQNDLKHQAMHDDLTGLPNRNLMGERLRHIIAVANRQHTHPALLMLDLDGFKQVNDTLGHKMGDELLIAIGKRLTQLLRETDTIVRLGGDEFAVLIDDIKIDDAMDIAARILNVIQEPFEILSNKLFVSASLGIAHFPEHGDNGTLLLQHADVAMYHAKRNKLGVAIYDPEIGDNLIQSSSLIADLRNALNENLLELYYQPKVFLGDKKTTGLEALLRWNHPEKGFIPPDKIIAMAEQSGLINKVFEWVFNEASKQMRHWIDNGLKINIAVNLSVYDLQHHDIVNSIEKTIQQYNLSPSYFTVEVTESAMMADPEKTIEKLSAIDEMGARISIDDYGTGYSSLSYLKKLPVDELKIDKSFVMQMDKDENDAIIVRSTIDLAHNLGLKVVAEGVENQDILDLLSELGCDVAQGFYLSRPMPSDQVEQWVFNHDNDNFSE